MHPDFAGTGLFKPLGSALAHDLLQHGFDQLLVIGSHPKTVQGFFSFLLFFFSFFGFILFSFFSLSVLSLSLSLLNLPKKTQTHTHSKIKGAKKRIAANENGFIHLTVPYSDFRLDNGERPLAGIKEPPDVIISLSFTDASNRSFTNAKL